MFKKTNVSRLPLFFGLLAMLFAVFWNELNVLSLRSFPESISSGKTIQTADDASYLAPAENFVRGKGFRNNLDGAYSYYMRPPGYSLVYLAFRSWLPEKKALQGLKTFQILLFGLSISCLFSIFLLLQIHRKIAVFIVAFYVISGISIGFLYYSLTEALTPALLLFFIYFLLLASTKTHLREKKRFYFLAFLLFGFIFITRPVLGVFALTVPILLYWDEILLLKYKIQQLLLFILLGFGPMLFWQLNGYFVSGKVVGLHPIYATENLQTPYRPVHQAFWEFAKSWGEKGPDFHAYAEAFWTKNYHKTAGKAPVMEVINKLPKSVVKELGARNIKNAFHFYQLAIVDQRNFFDQRKAVPKNNFYHERAAIHRLEALTAQYRQNHFFDYHFVAPMKVFSQLVFHSNLSLHIFQETYRGNPLMELLRYCCALFHFTLFILLPLSLFTKSSTKQVKVIMLSTAIYVFYLFYFQRGIEERYTLPILALLTINLGLFLSRFFSLLNGKPTPENE